MKEKIAQTKVCVMGLGYVGLPTAAFLAGKGYNVTGVDVQNHIVDTLNRGEAHIHEPDLNEKIRAGLASGKFRADVKPDCSDVFIVTVPTPVNTDRSPDVSYVRSAFEMLIPSLKAGSIVILESTSPVGTTEEMAELIRSRRPDLAVPQFTRSENGQLSDENRIFISYCPERILPGQMFKEFVNNDRIIGGIDPISATEARDFYKTFVRGALLVSDCRTAEMAKLSENTFRDVNIALANELSRICDKLGIDVWELINLANHHPRVNILSPGPGVGGHCIPVDPWFIHHSAPELAALIRTARETNDSMPGIVAAKALEKCQGIKSPKIAVLGLAYKPDIDDLRESPAVETVLKLAQSGAADIIAVEPYIEELPASLRGIPGITLSADPAQAIEEADVIALLVAHWQFHGIHKSSIEGKRDRIIDATGIWRDILTNGK